MTWHTSTTSRDRLDNLLAEIRHRGGVVARCERSASGLVITWFTH